MERDLSTGYYGRHLWLPKKYLNLPSAKKGLEFPVMGEQGVEYLQLWSDREHHLVVPREFVRRSTYEGLPFKIIRTTPKSYRKVRFKDRITLDFKDPSKTIQRDAFKAFMAADCGLLNLGCGRGKTVIALKHIAAKQVPALVIVNTTTLIGQWRDRISEYLEVEGGVGIVQGPPDTWDWKGRGIVLASLMSAAIRYQELPEGFSWYFGGVYYDECHHLSAEVFSHTCPMFFGNRYGLTATPKREDGLELVYQYHLGPIFYKYLKQELVPKFYFMLSPVKLDLLSGEVNAAITDKNGKVNLPKLRTYLGRLEENNAYIADEIKRAAGEGRKILALSHSVEQLVILNKMFPGSGLVIGDIVDIDKRLRALRESQITFGTLNLVKEGLDEDTLDTLFLLTPFGSRDVAEGGKNTLQQGMGRILRPRERKMQPVVVAFDHMYIPKLHKQCNKMKQLLTEWPEDEGGPFTYETIRAYEEIK